MTKNTRWCVEIKPGESVTTHSGIRITNPSNKFKTQLIIESPAQPVITQETKNVQPDKNAK
jgi:hypothetical protein